MKIEIEPDVICLLKKLYKDSLPKETGGILFGRYSEDLNLAHITDIYYNIEDSKMAYRSFIRGKKGFRQYSKKMWREKKYYLGEWHTHPNSLPYMSLQDKNQMVEIQKLKKMKCPEPILLIIGEKNRHILISTQIFLYKNIISEQKFI
ncbi:Mov34/MPN/PAD-1 family protein [Listeria monocytogenes]